MPERAKSPVPADPRTGRRRRRASVRAAAAALIWLGGAGTGAADLYSAEELAEARAAYADGIRHQLREDMGVGPSISLDLPDRGAHPLAAWSEPSASVIRIPIETVMFLDDLGILWTYLDRRGCEMNYALVYLHALLREGRDLPGPLEAFGLDREAALSDPAIDATSAAIASTGVLFLLAHEVGHLALAPDAAPGDAEAPAQEIAADRVALEAFREQGRVPVGAAFTFLAARWLDPARARHALTPGRIARLGEAVLADPAAFAHGEADPKAGAARARALAEDLLRIARRAEEAGVMGVLPEGVAEAYPLERLRAACG